VGRSNQETPTPYPTPLRGPFQYLRPLPEMLAPFWCRAGVVAVTNTGGGGVNRTGYGRAGWGTDERGRQVIRTEWYNTDGVLHRTAGPARERWTVLPGGARVLSFQVWFLNGEAHRKGGPAVRGWYVDEDGTRVLRSGPDRACFIERTAVAPPLDRET